MKVSLIAVGAAAFLLISSQASTSAEISFQEGPKDYKYLGDVVIDGEIIEGDFERFLGAVLEAGTDPRAVFVSSRGGSVVEAMKIGRMIRTFGFKTRVPRYGGPDLPLSCAGAEVNECTCVSACLLIFVAGVAMAGDYIEVHRTFLDHADLRKMSIVEAANYSNVLSELVRTYLKEMGSPASLSEIMKSIPSNETKKLDREYIHENFWGPAENIEEWIIARCGNSESILDERYRLLHGNLSAEERIKFEELGTELEDGLRCTNDAFNQERRRVFTKSMVSELDAANDKYLAPELRSLKRTAHKFDLQDLIGLPVAEAKWPLMLLGFGAETATLISGMTDSSGSWLVQSSFDIDVNNNQITRVALFFRSNDESYVGFTLLGLSANPSLEEFRSMFGSPNYEVSGNNVFRTKRADIIPHYLTDSQSLWLLEISNHLHESLLE